MARVIRVVLSSLAGMTLAGGLIVAVEVLSNAVYPMPPGSGQTEAEICEHVAQYPQWILAVVVPVWSATALAGTWVATRLGGRIAGFVVSLVLIAGSVINVSMLPYVLWFKVAVVIGVPLGCLLGIFLPRRPSVSAPPGQTASSEMS
jgi:hypothetical protein